MTVKPVEAMSDSSKKSATLIRQYKLAAYQGESQEEYIDRVMQTIRNSIDVIYDLLWQRLDCFQFDLP